MPPYLISFLAGLVISFISSLPVGPVNLAIVHATLVKGRGAGFRIAVGALMVETFFCFLAISGISLINTDAQFLKNLQVISIPILIIMGIVSLVKKDFLKRSYEPKPGNEFFTGVTLTVTNPMLLLFWVTISAVARSNEWLGEGYLNHGVFLSGVSLGIFLLFYTLIRLSSGHDHKMTPRLKRNMNRILGWIFIALAIIISIRVALR